MLIYLKYHSYCCRICQPLLCTCKSLGHQWNKVRYTLCTRWVSLIYRNVSPSASMTGTPILWAPMASIVNASDRQTLVSKLLDTIAGGDVTPLETAQFTIQLAWLTQKNPTVPEVQVIFPSLPGTPGLPLSDGSLGVWMPTSHVVSPKTLNGCRSGLSLHCCPRLAPLEPWIRRTYPQSNSVLTLTTAGSCSTSPAPILLPLPPSVRIIWLVNMVSLQTSCSA